jgi:hypothetical protein
MNFERRQKKAQNATAPDPLRRAVDGPEPTLCKFHYPLSFDFLKKISPALYTWPQLGLGASPATTFKVLTYYLSIPAKHE